MIFLIVVVSTILAVVVPWSYFRKENKECQRYAFYKFRDDIAWEIANSDQPEAYLETYQVVNGSISRLHHFGFWSFLDFMTSKLADQLEEHYQARRDKRTPKMTAFDIHERSELGNYEYRFATLLSDTVKKNSFWLRLSMTPFGYRIMFAPVLAGSLMKFFKRHPELSRKILPKLLAIRSYSVLGESLRKTHEDHRHKGFV